jgi:hypothetical protein
LQSSPAATVRAQGANDCNVRDLFTAAGLGELDERSLHDVPDSGAFGTSLSREPPPLRAAERWF